MSDNFANEHIHDSEWEVHEDRHGVVFRLVCKTCGKADSNSRTPREIAMYLNGFERAYSSR